MTLKEIIAQLKTCVAAISEVENATPFKGPLIDAESHILSAIRHIDWHTNNKA